MYWTYWTLRYTNASGNTCVHPGPANDYWSECESQADVLQLMADVMRKLCLFTQFLHHLSPKNVQVNTFSSAEWSAITSCLRPIVFSQLLECDDALFFLFFYSLYAPNVVRWFLSANCCWSTSLKINWDHFLSFIHELHTLVAFKSRVMPGSLTSREWKHSLGRDYWKSIQPSVPQT